MADAATAAYQQQQQQQQQPPHNAQPPPPPPGGFYSDNVSYDNSQQQRQPQYPQQQPPPFHKPNINIRPLIETGPTSSPATQQSDYPTVDFAGGASNQQQQQQHNATHQPTASDYAFNTEDEPPFTSLTSSTRRVHLRYQLFLDRISPHWKARWVFSLLALAVFVARVVLSQGWYVICYGLGIYYLNLLIGFISPRVDPSLASGEFDDDDDAGPMLPTNASDEFKPFIRRVPEFKFWISGTKATLIALFLTLFSIFDVPVFWPILLIYFIILFACTMRQQIKHMIRYSYVPWDSGKKKYAGRGGGGANNEPTTI